MPIPSDYDADKLRLMWADYQHRKVIRPASRRRIRDIWDRPFPAKITGGSAEAGYNWTEQAWDGSTDEYVDLDGGRTNKTQNLFAWEDNGNTVSVNTIVELYERADKTGTLFYSFNIATVPTFFAEITSCDVTANNTYGYKALDWREVYWDDFTHGFLPLTGGRTKTSTGKMAYERNRNFIPGVGIFVEMTAHPGGGYTFQWVNEERLAVVDLLQDGGADGSVSSKPTYTYTVKPKGSATIILATTASPLKPREKGSFIAATGGMALIYGIVSAVLVEAWEHQT